VRHRSFIAKRCLFMAAVLALILSTGLTSATRAADEPDLIFRKSTVFKWLTPNDKLATYAIDDPEVEGVACHFTVPERGGVKGWLGIAEEVSDISLSCRCRSCAAAISSATCWFMSSIRTS